MNNISRNKLLKQSYQTFLNKCHAIILIYGDDNTYEILQSDAIFSGRIPESGSLKTLYKSLFLNKEEGEPSLNENHEPFMDIQMFKKDNYHDYIHIDQKQLAYRVLSMGENVFGLYFMDISDSEKSNLISTISHEFRTPLTSILGFNELIMRKTSDKEILSYAENIQDAGHLLLQLINSILDYSRIASGKLELFPSAYSTKTLLGDVQSIVSILAREKDLDFVIEADPTLPPYLYGDDLRIKQILINLITNAIKYTKKGSVTLYVSFDSFRQNKGVLNVKISDTGEGIRQEDMNKLYSSFERINESMHHGEVGTGLGMSIVLSLLKQMGSKLEVESVYGQGSTFSFQLIQNIPSSQEQINAFKNRQTPVGLSEDTLHLEGKNILIVDDMKINRQILSTLLGNTKANIQTADSGEKCISLAKNNHFDIILMDYLMPDMDGIEALKQIRNLDDYEHTPVIALTANVFSGSKQFYREQGFSDFLEKPIDYQSLIFCLTQYLS